MFERFTDRSRRVMALANQSAQRFQNVTLTGEGDPERVVATGVSDRWAETLGVHPVLAGEINQTNDGRWH